MKIRNIYLKHNATMSEVRKKIRKICSKKIPIEFMKYNSMTAFQFNMWKNREQRRIRMENRLYETTKRMDKLRMQRDVDEHDDIKKQEKDIYREIEHERFQEMIQYDNWRLRNSFFKKFKRDKCNEIQYAPIAVHFEDMKKSIPTIEGDVTIDILKETAEGMSEPPKKMIIFWRAHSPESEPWWTGRWVVNFILNSLDVIGKILNILINGTTLSCIGTFLLNKFCK